MESKVDWDDPKQVDREIDRVFTMFKHLNECAAADGGVCPNCGSSQVRTVEHGRRAQKKIMARRCEECGTGYTRYTVDVESSEERWSPEWHPSVQSYAIEGYPYYVYFKPGTHVCEGVGPDILPWEQI